jgi:hypothetical protein
MLIVMIEHKLKQKERDMNIGVKYEGMNRDVPSPRPTGIETLSWVSGSVHPYGMKNRTQTLKCLTVI